MAITNELMLAILAMDAYNRGYNPGVSISGTSLGDATLGVSSDIEPGIPGVAASFFAQSYTLADGSTVISYRGTDRARVSDETDARLRAAPGQPIRLRPDEWAAGPNHWLVDIAGEPRAIASAFEALLAGPFKDREVKILATDASGAPGVSTLGALLQSAQNTAGSAA
ncbi:MAG: hypothetical protein C0511_20300 [Hyphomicrobium sp.]|nr:hypothetical protein [Gordonia sp. (in: high G+C Gram-positive bacteria)]MBA4174924.1 hypothetical protein [Hyphomicrobium sp.]